MNLSFSKKHLLILGSLVVVVIVAGLAFYWQQFHFTQPKEPTNQPAANPVVQPTNQPTNQAGVNQTPQLPFVPLDSDGDGLSDDKEKEIGTDPNNKDTDQDGIIDGAEGGKFFKTNPLNPDTDGDGYKDGEEVFKGHDPTKKDAKMPAGPPPGSVGSKP